jgi:hypothetical protein
MLIHSPPWNAIPLAVFIVAIGLKIWRLGRLLNHSLRTSPWALERFRSSLERSWQRQSQPTAWRSHN